MTTWNARLVRPLDWEPLPDGTVRLRDPSRGEWVRTQSWTRGALEALEAGASGPEAVAAALAHQEAPSEARVKRFLLSLEKVGLLRIDVPVPDAFGPWRVLGELGRGGVGIAYACERDGIAAVAKEPWDFLHASDKAAAAVRHEADVLARLDHPAIVRRLDLVEHEGAPVLVRERVDGPSLTTRYEGRPVGAGEAAAVSRALADILAHLHERGLVLVDTKPGNFVLDERIARWRLLDAGHCRPPGTTRVGGTPGFMAPELEKRGAATPQSDVWGLGRLHAFLLSGRLPHLRGAPDDPLADVPPEQAARIEPLLRANPFERPAGIAAALARLT